MGCFLSRCRREPTPVSRAAHTPLLAAQFVEPVLHEVTDDVRIM
jgi:hypothetical protein